MSGHKINKTKEYVDDDPKVMRLAANKFLIPVDAAAIESVSGWSENSPVVGRIQQIREAMLAAREAEKVAERSADLEVADTTTELVAEEPKKAEIVPINSIRKSRKGLTQES